MSKDLLVLADEYAAATATFARSLALKDGTDSMSPIARDAGDKRAALAEAIAALDAAQPVCGYDDKTGNCTRVNCCKQAQPERAPLSPAQVTVLLDSYYASDFGPDELIRKVEQLHGIKQGGQHD